MGYTLVALENKLLDMYPEIPQHGLSPPLKLDQRTGMARRYATTCRSV